MIKYVGAYFVGFILFFMFISIFGNKGFRDRVFITFLWPFWICINLIGTICAFIDAFIHNGSIEESICKIFKMKIFNLLFKLVEGER